jgi:acetyl-CoA carboxylase alpha subunit
MFKQVELTRKAAEVAMQNKVAANDVEYTKTIEEPISEQIRKAAENGHHCAIVSVTASIAPYLKRLEEDLRKQGYTVGVTASAVAVIW